MRQQSLSSFRPFYFKNFRRFFRQHLSLNFVNLKVENFYKEGRQIKR